MLSRKGKERKKERKKDRKKERERFILMNTLCANSILNTVAIDDRIRLVIQ